MTLHLVLDASLVLAAILVQEPDAEKATAALQTLDSTHGIVPGIWPAEVGNALVQRERRGLIQPPQLDSLLAWVETLPLQIDHDGTGPSLRDVIKLARKHGLTVYDALYLELALRQHASLATLDEALVAAARREGVALTIQDT